MDMKDHRKRPRDPAQLAKFIVVKDDDGAVVCSAKCATRWIARMVARAAEILGENEITEFLRRAYRPGETLEAALDRADVALYEAKHTGKNKACVAP